MFNRKRILEKTIEELERDIHILQGNNNYLYEELAKIKLMVNSPAKYKEGDQVGDNLIIDKNIIIDSNHTMSPFGRHIITLWQYTVFNKELKKKIILSEEELIKKNK